MKQFEHEILTFGTTTKKDYEKMRQSLSEWGEAGFEVVSVVPTAIDGSEVTIFLKREISILTAQSDRAA